MSNKRTTVVATLSLVFAMLATLFFCVPEKVYADGSTSIEIQGRWDDGAGLVITCSGYNDGDIVTVTVNFTVSEVFATNGAGDALKILSEDGGDHLTVEIKGWGPNPNNSYYIGLSGMNFETIEANISSVSVKSTAPTPAPTATPAPMLPFTSMITSAIAAGMIASVKAMEAVCFVL